MIAQTLPTKEQLIAKRTNNAITAAIEAFLKLENVQQLTGIKTVKSNISPQDMIEAMKKEAPYFPAVFIVHISEPAKREGSSLVCAPTWSLFVCDRSVAGAYVSGSRVIDLMDDLVTLLDYRRLCIEQGEYFTYGGKNQMYQDTNYVLYQMQFATTVAHGRR